MKGLDFRKKRKKPSQRPRRKPGSSRLKFEDKRQKLHFERRHIVINAKVVVIWAVEILILCMAAVFLVLAFGERVSVAGDSMNPVLKNGDIVLINRLAYGIKSPSRGDVVAFQPNGDEDAHYQIKRIVGLPGETVQITDGSVYIDGEQVTDHVYVIGIDYAGLAEEPLELGKDEYFVMGDNASASDDSRTPEIGNVSRDDIYGKVWFEAGFGDNFGFVSD